MKMSAFIKNLTLSISITSLSVTLIVLIIIFILWKRGRTYYLAWKMPGPIGYPLVGVIPYFINAHEIIPNSIRFFKKYGDVFRIWLGPIVGVIIAKPEHLKIILNSPHCLGKDPLAYCQDPDFAGKGLIIIEPESWKVHRKMLNPAFNQKILDSYIDIFIEQTEILVKQLQKKVGQPEFNIYDFTDKCTLDVICETSLGTKIESQTKSSNLTVITARIFELLMERVCRIWLNLAFIWEISARGKEFKKLSNAFHMYTNPVLDVKQAEYEEKKQRQRNGEIIEDFSEESTKRKLFIDIVLEAEDGKKFSKSEMYQEISTLINTGTDTVALTTAYCLLAIGQNPDIQDKVVEELNEIFGQTDRPITLDDLPKLKYLEQVFKESMRLYTPVPFVAREVTEEVNLGEYIVPKHAMAIISFIWLHQNPQIWPNPHKFDPDRLTPEECAKRHPYSYLPFSGGPRNCIGIRYGYMLAKVILATILRKYKVGAKTKYQDMKFVHKVIMKPEGGINIFINNRHD